MSKYEKDQELVRRLGTLDAHVPLAVTVAGLALQLGHEVPRPWQYQIRKRGSRRSGLEKQAWLWPASLLLRACTAIRAPAMANLADLQQFVCSARLVERLMEGKTTSFLREKLGLLSNPPHGLIALAYLSGHERALGAPSNSDGPTKMSRAELTLAWHVWDLTRLAAEEIQVAMQSVGVGLCRHCGELLAADRQTYCSERCRKAFHNAQSYTKRSKRPAD